MIQRAGRMLTHFEPELVGWLMEAFDRIGVRVITAAAVTAIERNESGFSVYAERNGEPLRVDADLLVHAAGRGPALGRLNLEAANAETEGGRLGAERVPPERQQIPLSMRRETPLERGRRLHRSLVTTARSSLRTSSTAITEDRITGECRASPLPFRRLPSSA